MGKCLVCQRDFQKLNCTIWYRKGKGKMCCEQCVKENSTESLVSIAKQMSTVSWHDLEEIGLIEKFKGRVEVEKG